MSADSVTEIREKLESSYRKRTPKSQNAFREAGRYLPGGDTRSVIFFKPYPLWIREAGGCHFTDLDGNRYLDFFNCATTLILGHANPVVMAAVRDQLARGTAHGGLMPVVVRWADIMCRRVRSVERIRFTNSGTEAVMMAVRAARAFTGKDKILKMDWGYGGSYDPVIYPSDAAGVPRSARADSLIVPYNDEQAAEAAITRNKDRLAAVVVEGMMGAAGQIPPEEGYLKHLREVTAASGVLLILDEIQCFRLDCGGIQQLAGIEPDITTFGKIIGGGFPVGAFGGRAPIMELFAPDSQKISHSGTLNANPVTATAGVATLEHLTAAEIARLNGLGELLADGIRRVFRDLGIRGQVTGRGSLQNIHFCPVPVRDGHTAKEVANQEIVPLLHLALMERGVFMGKGGLLDISTPMGESEIKEATEAVVGALEDLMPAIRKAWPELIES